MRGKGRLNFSSNLRWLYRTGGCVVLRIEIEYYALPFVIGQRDLFSVGVFAAECRRLVAFLKMGHVIMSYLMK
jgi:hypothetical protein